MDYYRNNTVQAVPIPEDNSQLDEIIQLERQSELRKAQANESIIELNAKIDEMSKESKKQFVFAIVVSGLTLMAAVASIII